MRMRITIVLSSLVLLSCAEGRAAEERRQQAHDKPLAFKQLPVAPPSEIQFDLENGEIVYRDEFPAVLSLFEELGCTASLIGPRTVMLAAHCFFGHSIISVEINGSPPIKGKCDRTDGYAGNGHPEDIALCLLDQAVEGVLYETLDIDTEHAVGVGVVLSGYGCTEEGRADGNLRIGRSTIRSRPSSIPPHAANLFARSVVREGDPRLCQGDSGGPLFRFAAGPTGPRYIIGVNSRILESGDVSIFAATASRPIKKFINDWAMKNNQKICGLAGHYDGCK